MSDRAPHLHELAAAIERAMPFSVALGPADLAQRILANWPGTLTPLTLAELDRLKRYELRISEGVVHADVYHAEMGQLKRRRG